MKQILLFICFYSLPGFTQPVSEYMDDPNGAIIRQLGPLRTIVIEHDKKAPYIVYLHGWMGTSLQTYENYLRDEIAGSPRLRTVNWLIPDSKGSAWFNIETEDFSIWEQGLKHTRSDLERMLKAAKVDPRRVIWSGFSQGAITAADFVLHSNAAPLALMINSGYYFDSSDLKKTNRKIKGVPFFMIHDRSDSTLPLSMTRKLEAKLLENGMVGRLQWQKMGHEMHPGFLSKATGQLKALSCSSSLTP